jgi:hypothetical protein
MKHFIAQWQPQSEKVSYILQYLHTYPNVLSDLRIKDLITPDELYRQQEDWIWLCSKFTGMEQDFFKPYWIPIQSYGYDYFIDVSDDKFPIIESFFNYFEKPYHWEKKYLFKSITKFMLSTDNENIDWEQYRVHKLVEKYFSYKSKEEKKVISFNILRKFNH